MTFAFAALALLLAPADSLDAPAVVPTPDQATGSVLEDGDVRFRGRFSPWALYSRDYGFGIGAGVGVENLVTTGSDLTLDATYQQHLQDARLAFFSSDPYTSRLHIGVQASASTTERRRYYGLGPTTLEVDEVNLFQNTIQGEVRAGVYPSGTSALYVQPSLGLRYDYSSGFNAEDSDGTLDPLDAPSRAAVTVGERQDRYGVDVGLEVASDRLDRISYPSRGTLVSAGVHQFVALDDSDLTTTRLSASLTGYVPIRGRTVGIVRAVGVTLRSGDADGDGVSDAVPFYYLPTLDNRLAPAYRPNRLTGRDVLALGAGLRAPVLEVAGTYGLDAQLMVHVGNAYADVVDQFSLRVSLEDGSDLEDGRAALRLSLIHI